MVNPSQVSHEAKHRSLVEQIVTELRPVRRLWPVRVRLALWMVLEVVLVIFVVSHSHRTDLTGQSRNGWYLVEVGAYAAIGTIGAAFALLATIPGRGPTRGQLFVLAVLTATLGLLLLRQPLNVAVPVAGFITAGLPCALGIVMFASLPLLALLWAVKRGAPLAPGAAGALAGAGGFLFSFALMRVYCPIDEGLHLLVWHFLPALLGVAVSAGLGFWLFRRRAPRRRANSG